MMRGERRAAVIMRFAETASSEEGEMSIFPTKILLATDGSGEAELAARTALDLGRRADSDLHVVYVSDADPTALLYLEATDPEGG
jgi:universal stress protein family protein